VNRLDLKGKRFGRLVVIRYEKMKNGNSCWRCLCDCGRKISVQGRSLGAGNTRSCGCLASELSSARVLRKPPGLLHGGTYTPEYRVWAHMKQRCTNSKLKEWKNYGGRGIRVCVRWRESFAAFLSDIGPRPAGKSIDRYPNNDGNYEPGNCRWATPLEQGRNKRQRSKAA